MFLVADSNSATATSRGVNGLLAARADNNTQNTATLQEWHDLVRKTRFNIFASQGNQREIMQQTTMAVVNRKIDSDIITTLGGATVTMTATIPTVSDFQKATVLLQNAEVPWDSNITLLCQPSFLSYLEEAPEFSSADYIELRPYAGQDANWRDKPTVYRWKNTLVISHPNLTGKATSSEKSYLYHKSAIGHAADTEGMDNAVGYNDEHDYSYARCSIFMGSVLMQAAGVVEITHDGSARGA